MQPQDYNSLSEPVILALCAWREAQNQGRLGMRGVCWNVMNRVKKGGWWGGTIHAVILHPYQYSSFNAPPRTKITDRNESKWPEDNDLIWPIALEEANSAIDSSSEDLTAGATFYWSPPLTAAPEHEWGPTVETIQIIDLHFCKPAP